MNFRLYLETRYAAACDMQRQIRRDPQMVAMLRVGPPDPNLVQAWMRNYGLFQGITAQNRVAIVNRYLKFAAEHVRHPGEPSAAEIQTMYADLFRAFYGAVPRSWASATSKLLWCLYPETVVIYDAFVHRVLVVMQCIDADLASFPRIGEAPKIKAETDIALAVEHYMNYQAMVHQLLTAHEQLLAALRVRNRETYPYDIRILDKVLWMFGNSKEAYAGQA
jgi:hypothetical protein